MLFDVISQAYEHHSLMVSTNLAFEEWTEIFGSERLTGVISWKLIGKAAGSDRLGNRGLMRVQTNMRRLISLK